MTNINTPYELGKQLALREFEKQAFAGAISGVGKAIWNSPFRKALGYLTGFGGRIGSQGSFAYKYLPSSSVGIGLGSGLAGAAAADEGNKLNAFATGAIVGGVGMGAFRHFNTLGKRILTPWMRRSNINRYSNMGFKDPNAVSSFLRKNEFNYIDEMMSHKGGNINFLNKYVNSQQFKLLDQSQQNFIRQGLASSAKNNGYADDVFKKGLAEMKANANLSAKQHLANTQDSLTKFKYHLGTKGKYIGAVGGGLGISTMAHDPLQRVTDATVGKLVPKTKAVPSNVYNPYYGGM